MAEKTTVKSDRPSLSVAAVADYLLAHPDFFQTQKKLLARLSVPHPAGGAVSLVERQVEVLRQENRRLERHLVEWMEIAQDNDRLLGHLHTLAVALLAESDPGARVTALSTCLREDFAAEAIALIVHEPGGAAALPGARQLDRDDSAFAGLNEALRNNRSVCRPLSAAQSKRFFPDRPPLGSAAFVPILGDNGILVLASADAKHFHSGLDTTYLARLGELASAALAGAGQ